MNFKHRRGELPDVEMGLSAPSKPQLCTTMNVMAVMGWLNFSIKFNMMRGVAVIQEVGESHVAQRTARQELYDSLATLGIHDQNKIDAILEGYAQHSRYHPMRDWLEGLVWHGGHDIEELCGTVTTDNELWPVYLEKWLIQVVEAVCGWEREEALSLPHVLVLVGGQGVGKTHWLQNLGGKFVLTEAELNLGSVSKDSQVSVLQHPMVELAELDGITKRNAVSAIKSFISRTLDVNRAVYARLAIERPRMTVFCGSVNDAGFLADTTGSRRFHPVSVEAIAWGHAVDFDQVWGQAYALWQSGESFLLDRTQEARRAEMAVREFTHYSLEEEYLIEYLDVHKGRAEFELIAMNKSDIKDMLFGHMKHFGHKETRAFEAVLIRKLGKYRTNKREDGTPKQRSWMVRRNAHAQDRKMWPRNAI